MRGRAIWPPCFVVLQLFTPFISAVHTKSERCVVASFEALTYLSFAGPQANDTTFLADACTNRLRTYSTYAAAKVYCKRDEIDAGLGVLDRDCAAAGFARIPYDAVEPVLTDEYLGSLRVVEFGEVDKGVELGMPVLISRDYFWRAYRTNEAWALESWAHNAFGNVAYWFWGAVLLSGVLNRLFAHSFGSRGRGHQGHPSCLKRVYNLTKTHLILPSAIGTYHQRLLYWCSIPTRLEAVVIGLYYILSLLLTVVTYDVFQGNLYWDDISTQTWRYLSDRTGIMSYANLVMLWLFGTRNNVFLWGTGWGFATFNLFHRAIARVATIQAIVHSVGYTVLALQSGTYAIYWPSAWWYMGAAATISFGLLLGFSSVWLRRNYYEIFLLLHIGLSVIGLIGLFFHTSIFKGEYDHYLWPVVVIWCLDRFARLVRLICNNLRVQAGDMRVSSTKTIIRYDKASDLIRLDVTPSSPSATPKPGQFYYIYQPFKWRGYESHPLTVGSWSVAPSTPQCVEGLTSPASPLLEGQETGIVDSQEIGPGKGTGSQPGCRLTFWVRPFNGWTNRLRSECLASSSSSSPTPTAHSTLLLEGPYGIHQKLYEYEHILLLAGGVGIAAALPHIEEHLRRTSPVGDRGQDDTSIPPSPSPPFAANDAAEGDRKGNVTRTKSITLVWAVRQEDFIHALASRELRASLGRDDIEFHFHSTGREGTTTQVPRRADETTCLLSPLLSSPSRFSTYSSEEGTYSNKAIVDIKPGRPNIPSIINNTLYSIYGDDQVYARARTAILVCGPAAMADEARSAVHGALKRGYTEVEYFEEAFGW